MNIKQQTEDRVWISRLGNGLSLSLTFEQLLEIEKWIKKNRKKINKELRKVTRR